MVALNAGGLGESEGRERVVNATRQKDSKNCITGTALVVLLVAALVGSACLMTAATQSPDARWLGWVALLPLFLAIRVFTPLRAFGAGAVWGLSLSFFSSVGGAAPGLESILLLTLIPGLYAGLGALLTRRVGFSPLLLGLGWIGVELALKPLSLHNGLLAATQGNGLFVRTLGHLAGYTLLAFLVAYVNASFLEMLTEVCIRRDGGRLITIGGGQVLQRLFSLNLPDLRSHLIRRSRPRAPPIPQRA